MPFNDAQVKLLSGKLSDKHVKTREQRGMTLSYIEGWHVIAEANRVFGFDGWDRETVRAEPVWEDGRRDPKMCAYAARVRVRVRAGDVTVCRDGSGVGQGSGSTLGEAHESALKEAETDATKRALTTFGNLFGLALYDKQQSGVRHASAPKRNGLKAAVSWTQLSATGEPLTQHDMPQGFCTAMREALNMARDLAQLEGVWTQNAPTLNQMRAVWPHLKTVHGDHYADVLERLYGQQVIRLSSHAEREQKRAAANSAIDKSELALPTAKKVRDKHHLEFVASLPCLVCGRIPSQAHHLRFAQPRALSSKVSDEWTVPLCALHHRALHDAGAEADWWEAHGIDAKGEAEQLWRPRLSRATAGPAATAATPSQNESEQLKNGSDSDRAKNGIETVFRQLEEHRNIDLENETIDLVGAHTNEGPESAVPSRTVAIMD